MNTPIKHDVLIFDVESYYDNDYSLRKMSTPAYILDPRYETIMVAVKLNDGDHMVIDGPDFPDFLSQLDPNTTTTVSFNSLFDNSILAWRYGFVPKTMIDAMGLSRALLGHELASFSLRNVANHLNLGSKGTALTKVLGMRRAGIMAAGLWGEFAGYAIQDNILCEGIFERLYPQMPWSERRVMDLVLRCCVEPRFVADQKLLTDHLRDVRDAKAALLSSPQVGGPTIVVVDLMSAPKFKKKLEDLGVVVEMKLSPKTGKLSPCFARTDEFMTTLQEHNDPKVQALAAARLGFKSTLEETRTEKLLSIANLPWAVNADGTPRLYSGGNMPIPLAYGKTHTHRLSGDWGMNMQNLPADRKKDGKSKLRASLKVPPHHKVITCDLGQIEARMAAWICGCERLLTEFRDKKDPYSLLASNIFGRPINRKLPGDEIEGFIGKTGILGLGYGAGKDKFDTMVRQTSRTMGIDISKIYSRAIGDKAVDTYRSRYRELPRGWNVLSAYISTVWLSGSGATAAFGPVRVGYGYVEGPNGLFLRYAEPQMTGVDELGRSVYKYRYGKVWHKMYGAKFLENIVQFLARIIVMNAALRIRDRGFVAANPADYRFVLQAHDELVFIVHDDEVDRAKRIIHTEMIRPPSWGRDIPLVADVGVGNSYGEAK